MRRLPASLLVWTSVALGLIGVGCGEGGVSAGATVSVYVAAPLCAGARHALRLAGGKAGDAKVRGICLPPVTSDGHLELSVIGENARRATEDSRSVAYLEAPGPAAKFARPIVESADVAFVTAGSGFIAMRRVLDAIRDADSDSLRESVRKSLEGS